MGDYSISKYQPELYDDTGCYSRNEWTSVGDIGKTFYYTLDHETDPSKILDSVAYSPSFDDWGLHSRMLE